MMDSNKSLTDRIRNWFERTPKAQQVYKRLGTDLDAVVERVDAATSGLRNRIAPIIDPASAPAAQHEPHAARVNDPPVAQHEPPSETEPDAPKP